MQGEYKPFNASYRELYLAGYVAYTPGTRNHRRVHLGSPPPGDSTPRQLGILMLYSCSVLREHCAALVRAICVAPVGAV